LRTTTPHSSLTGRLLPGITLALCALLTGPARSAPSPVRILIDGHTLSAPASADTVREALQAAGVSLSPDDEVTPALSARPGTEPIRVRRVTFTERTTDAKIPYRTVIRPAEGRGRPFHPTVLKEGRPGLKRATYRVRLVDGEEAGRTLLREETVREASDQVVVARQPATLGSRGAYTGKRTLTMLATAYDPGPGSCGKYANGATCNGKRAGYGIIAVDPRLIPLGAKLFVPGYGYGIAADVGGAIKGSRIDLGYNSRTGARQWGKKWVQVTVLD
jgi:3D (Asp-Asp-Asp) domain-containing protein